MAHSHERSDVDRPHERSDVVRPHERSDVARPHERSEMGRDQQRSALDAGWNRQEGMGKGQAATPTPQAQRGGVDPRGLNERGRSWPALDGATLGGASDPPAALESAGGSGRIGWCGWVAASVVVAERRPSRIGWTGLGCRLVLGRGAVGRPKWLGRLGRSYGCGGGAWCGGLRGCICGAWGWLLNGWSGVWPWGMPSGRMGCGGRLWWCFSGRFHFVPPRRSERGGPPQPTHPRSEVDGTRQHQRSGGLVVENIVLPSWSLGPTAGNYQSAAWWANDSLWPSDPIGIDLCGSDCGGVWILTTSPEEGDCLVLGNGPVLREFDGFVLSWGHETLQSIERGKFGCKFADKIREQRCSESRAVGWA